MQDLNAQANPLETLAYIIAQQIHDHSIVYIGTGIPMVAGILAKKTHAPNITIVYESGGQDPIEGDMPWSVGCPFTWRKSPTIMEMSYSFAQCYNGYVDIGFLGFALNSPTLGQSTTIQTSGVVTGLSGLIPGADYYLSDTPGAISTSPGSNTRKIGVAISTTSLLITNIW